MTDSSPGGDNIDRRIWFIRGDRHAVRSPARGKEGLRTESDRPNSDLTEPLRLEMPERLCTYPQLVYHPTPPCWPWRVIVMRGVTIFVTISPQTCHAQCNAMQSRSAAHPRLTRQNHSVHAGFEYLCGRQGLVFVNRRSLVRFQSPAPIFQLLTLAPSWRQVRGLH